MNKFQSLIVLTSLLMMWSSSSCGWLFSSRRRRRACDATPCQWEWGPCSVTCGGGTRSAMLKRRKGSCGPCDMPSQSERCNEQCCPVDCKLSNWGSWSSCTASCGAKGIQIRVREVERNMSCNGEPCQKQFELQKCPKICFNDGFLVEDICKCSAGWTGSCCNEDVNECALSNHSCNAKYMTCANTNGGFSCGCQKGYVMSGHECKPDRYQG